MKRYVIVNSDGYIDNIIMAEPHFAKSLGAKDYYSGAAVGEKYSPSESDEITLESLQEENKLLKAQLQAQSDRSDFIEDCIAEMAMTVYGEV